MVQRFLNIVFILAISATAFSQNPYLHFAFNTGSANTDNGESIVADHSGNIYVAGYFTGTADFDPGPGTANLVATGTNLNIFVAKYTAGGAYQWAFSIPGSGSFSEGHSLFVDGSGNLYLTGSFSGSADFDPGAGSANLTSNGSTDIFVAKYTTAGNYQWAFSAGGANADYGSSITVDVNGYVYVTGAFQNSADFDPGTGTANLSTSGLQDVFLAKYNSAGAYQWAFNIGAFSVSNEGIGVAVDAASNVYITGSFYSVVDFDPGPGTTNLYSIGANDIFLAKYNSSGAYQWAFNIGGGTSDVGYSVAIDNSGNVYLSGYFQGPADFDPGAANAYEFGSGAFLAKYNAAGQYIWHLPIKYSGVGGNINIATSIALDQVGNIFLTGRFSGTAEFNPNGASTVLTSNGQTDIFVAKYNGVGICKWAFNAGSTSTDVGYAIAVDDPGSVYVTGNFLGTADFDPQPTTTNLSSNANSSDIFVAKYSPCPVVTGPGPITGNTTVCAGSTNTYSIDPVPGATAYAWTLPAGWSGSSTTNTITVIAGNTGGSVSAITSNICGPTYPVSLDVIVNPNLTTNVGLFVSPSGPVCQGKPVTFTAVNIGTAPAINYDFRVNGVSQQSGVSTTFTTSGLANGDAVTCVVTVTGPCVALPNATSNTIVETVMASTPTVTITASKPGPFCVGDLVQFNVTASNLSGGTVTDYTFKVHNINNQTGTSPTFNWNSEYGGDVYALITIAGSQCLTKDTASSNIIPLVVNPIPVISFNPPEQSILQGSSTILNANVSTPGTYLWSPSTGLNDPTILNPIASPAATTVYTLHVDAAGCGAFKQTRVNVYKDIYVPNTLVPNGNAANRVFRISSGSNLFLDRFEIFDRLGNKVFSTNNISDGWDGTYKGKPAQAGTYVYVIRGSDFRGNIFLKGTVLLIR